MIYSKIMPLRGPASESMTIYRGRDMCMARVVQFALWALHRRNITIAEFNDFQTKHQSHVASHPAEDFPEEFYTNNNYQTQFILGEIDKLENGVYFIRIYVELLDPGLKPKPVWVVIDSHIIAIKIEENIVIDSVLEGVPNESTLNEDLECQEMTAKEMGLALKGRYEKKYSFMKTQQHFCLERVQKRDGSEKHADVKKRPHSPDQEAENKNIKT